MFYDDNMLKLHEESDYRRNHKECELAEVLWDNGTINGMKNLLCNKEFFGGASLIRSNEFNTVINSMDRHSAQQMMINVF